MSLEIILEKNSAYIPALQAQQRIDYDSSTLANMLELYRYVRLYPDTSTDSPESEKQQIYNDFTRLGGYLFGLLVPPDLASKLKFGEGISLRFEDAQAMQIPWELISFGDKPFCTSVGVERRIGTKPSGADAAMLGPKPMAGSSVSLLSAHPWFDDGSMSAEPPEYCHLPNFASLADLVKQEYPAAPLSFSPALNERSFRDIPNSGAAALFLSLVSDDTHWYVESTADRSFEKIDIATVALTLRRACANGLRWLSLHIEKRPGAPFNLMNQLNRLQSSLPAGCVAFQGRMGQRSLNSYIFAFLANLFSAIPYQEAHIRALAQVKKLDPTGWDWFMPTLFHNIPQSVSLKNETLRGAANLTASNRPFEMFERAASIKEPRHAVSPLRLGMLQRTVASKSKVAAGGSTGVSFQSYFLALPRNADGQKAPVSLCTVPAFYWDISEWYATNGLNAVFQEIFDVGSYIIDNAFTRSISGKPGNFAEDVRSYIFQLRRGSGEAQPKHESITQKASPGSICFHEQSQPLSEAQINLDCQASTEPSSLFNYPKKERLKQAAKLLPASLLLNCTACRVMATEGGRLKTLAEALGALAQDGTSAFGVFHHFLGLYLKSYPSPDQSELVCGLYMLGGMNDMDALNQIYKNSIQNSDLELLLEHGMLQATANGDRIGIADNVASFITLRRPFPKKMLQTVAHFLGGNLISILSKESSAQAQPFMQMLRHFLLACLHSGLPEEASRFSRQMAALPGKDGTSPEAHFLRIVICKAMCLADSSETNYFSIERDLLRLAAGLPQERQLLLAQKMKQIATYQQNWSLMAACLMLEILLAKEEAGSSIEELMKQAANILYSSQKKKFWDGFAISYLAVQFHLVGAKALDKSLADISNNFSGQDPEKLSKFWIISALLTESGTLMMKDLLKAKQQRPSSYITTLIDAIGLEKEARNLQQSAPNQSGKLLAESADIYAVYLMRKKAIALRKEAAKILEDIMPEEAISILHRLLTDVMVQGDSKAIAECADSLGSIYFKTGDTENSTKHYSIAKQYSPLT